MMENNKGSVVLAPRSSEESLVDRAKPLPTSLQSDFIPDDVLLALTQPPCPREQLGPPSRHKTLAAVPSKRKPANVWNFKRKDRFRHLTESTPCICGSGNDISFLYDVPQPRIKVDRDDGFDPSKVRKEMDERKKTGLKLPDTLVPDEYHIVKNKGVMGIEYHEDKYTTQPDDHEKHLVLFPSLKPAGRYEVVQLRQAMENMLDKSGVNDEEVEIKGPSQMHNLLELIKKEQNIYNVIFHELIRQVSIECVDRGELLADLRNKYSNLLNKVPHQIKSLHEEVLAQRALDRRLTEELMRFKATITILTNELSEVKEHDNRVTKEAQEAQEDLRTALIEAQKNASLLSEYHELYELQRHRLENQVSGLTEEKEIWSTAAYCLALKVTEESKLTTAKSLHVSEKAWSKLANHFTILLSDKDTEMLTQIQGYVEKWRDLIENFNMALKKREEEMKSQLKSVQRGVEKWKTEYENMCFSKDGHFQSAPDAAQVKYLLEIVRGWEQVLTQVTESLTGEVFLSSEEELIFIRKHLDSWTDSAIKCFGRHRGPNDTNHPELDNMKELNEEVDDLLNQYYIRLTGENGAAQGIIHLLNVFETWTGRLTAHLNGTAVISENEWSRFNILLDDWLTEIALTIDYIGTTQKTDDRNENRHHIKRDIHEVVKKCQKWVSTATNSVDSEDAKLVEQVGALHSEMIKWMVQILLRLAPNRGDNSKEAADMSLIGSTTISQLQSKAKSLFERLISFSKYVTLSVYVLVHKHSLLPNSSFVDIRTYSCCDGIVLDNIQVRRDNREEDPEHEYRDLQKLRTECADWVETAKILMSQLTGEPIESLFPPESNQSATGAKTQKPADKKKPAAVSTEKPKTPKAQQEEPNAKPSGTETQVAEQHTKEEATDAGVAEVRSEEEKTKGTAEEKQAAEPDSSVPLEEESAALVVGQEEEEGEEVERVEAIGFDMNTHVHSLVQRAIGDLSDSAGTTSAEAKMPAQSKSPRPNVTSEPLTALQTLQTQLISTEDRCQIAEERAIAAESNLVECQEKLRSLEKELAQLKEAQTSTLKAPEPSPEKSESASSSPMPSDRRQSKDSSASESRTSRDSSEPKLKRSDSRSSNKMGTRARKKTN